MHRGLAIGMLSLAISCPATAEIVGTLELDSLSFIAFEGFENVPLPTGSLVRFRFGDPAGSTASFTILPSDVTIPPIEVRPGATLAYVLAGPASGTIRRQNGAIHLDFSASIQATLSESDGGGTKSYALHFTTRETSATNSAQTQSVEVEGMPVIQGPNYVQLVAGATNQPDAFPGPGAAVYGVLSGTFDAIPVLP